jgi:hypothetical protein
VSREIGCAPRCAELRSFAAKSFQTVENDCERYAPRARVEMFGQSDERGTGALVRLGVIDIISKGKAGLNSGEAAGFRYLLPGAESSSEQDSGLDL